MKSTQARIQQFNDAREWSNPSQLKDLLLNMSEEIGEMWHVIKWVDTPKQQQLIKENKAEVENFVGDMLYLILKIAYMCEVDSQKSIDDVLVEYEQRFPLDKTKGKHANVKAGGIDLKHFT